MGLFALLIRFQIFWNREEDAVCRKCQQTLSGGKECHQGRKMWKWLMESCLDTGLFGAETMLYPQWYSYLTRLRAESIPSPPLAFPLPAPHTVLAPLLHTGTQIQGLIHLRSKLKTKKRLFFLSWRKNNSQRELLTSWHCWYRWEERYSVSCSASAWGGSAAHRAGLCDPRTHQGHLSYSRFLPAEELLLTLFRVAKNPCAKRLPSNHDAVKTHKCPNVSMLQNREQSLPFKKAHLIFLFQLYSAASELLEHAWLGQCVL